MVIILMLMCVGWEDRFCLLSVYICILVDSLLNLQPGKPSLRIYGTKIKLGTKRALSESAAKRERDLVRGRCM